MSRWFKYIATLLIFTLALGACSRVGLAYRNLDVIIPWTLGDYLDMNGEQKDWFNERLKEHLNWHCTTQLPAYLDWLDRLQAMVETNQVTDAALQARTAEAKQAIAELGGERHLTIPSPQPDDDVSTSQNENLGIVDFAIRRRASSTPRAIQHL